MRNVLHFLGYQLAWWLCLAGLYYDMPVFVFLPMLVYILWHFLFFSQQKLRDLKAMLGITLLGVLVDSAFFYTGAMSIQGAVHFPLWLWLLWGCFSLTFPYALQTFRPYIWGSALIAGIGFPLTYSVPMRVGLFDFTSGSLWVMGVVWAVLFPMALHQARPRD